MRFIVAFFLGLQAQASFAANIDGESQIINSIQKRWNGQSTMGEAFTNLQKELGPEMYTFLTSKIKSAGLLQSKPAKLEKIGVKTFAMNSGSSRIVLEIKSLAESKIVLNHHELTFTSSEKPVEVWQKIQAALPEKMSRHFSLFFNDANAEEIGKKDSAQEIEEIGDRTVALIAETAAISKATEASWNCTALIAAKTHCLAVRTVVTRHATARTLGENVTSVADDIQYSKDNLKEIESLNVLKNTEPTSCPGELLKVQTCLDELVALGNRDLHVNLREGVDSAPAGATSR